MNNIEYIKYTFIHRKIVIYLANKYKIQDKEILEQIRKHDLDKMFMYLFYAKKNVSEMHRKLSSHHDNEIEKNYADYIEMVLDWESARYTKSDKPLNAYDTLYKYYPQLEEQILPILKEFKIDKTNMMMEDDVLNYAKSIKDVSISEIKKELHEYIDYILK